MKEYLVKCEDYDGDVHTKLVAGYDKQCAIESLTNCKEIYWVKLKEKVPTNFLP